MTNYSYPIELASVAINGADLIGFYYDSFEGVTGAFLVNADDPKASLLYGAVLETTYDTNAQYTLTGNDVNFSVTFAAISSTGVFQLQGSTITFTGTYELIASTGNFQINAADLNVGEIYVLTQASDASGAFTLTGFNLTTTQGRALQATTGTFLFTGQNATLRIKNGRLVATRGFFGLTGYDIVTQYLASTALPSLRPTKREFVPPTHSINTTKSINGLTYRRMFASTPSGAELRLTYENLPEADANTLLTLYDTAQGTYRSLTLPEATMAGAEPALQAYLNLNGTDQKWTFAGPPTLESIAPGVSTVTLALRSRIVPPSSRVPLPSLPACEVATPSTCYPYAGSGGGASLANVWFPLNTPPEPPPVTIACDGFNYVRLEWATQSITDRYWCGDCSGRYMSSDVGTINYSYIIATPQGYANATYSAEYETYSIPPEYQLLGELSYFHKNGIRWTSNEAAVGGQPNSTFFCPPNGPGGFCFGQTYIGPLYTSSRIEYSNFTIVCGNTKAELNYPATGLTVRPLENNPEFATLTILGVNLTGNYPTTDNTCTNAKNATVTYAERTISSYFDGCVNPILITQSGTPGTVVFNNVRWLKPAWRIGTCGVNIIGIEYENCPGSASPGVIQFLGLTSTTYGFSQVDIDLNISLTDVT